MRTCSLFAGIGGIDLAFMNVGCEIVWANEIDKRSCQTYRANFKHNLIECDIKNLQLNNLEPFDILTAGFPCQAFSVAGKKLGFEDERGNLFFELMRVVRFFKPKILFLENVKNIVSHNNGETFKQITDCIEAEGYKIKYKVMNTCEYSNIPQNRERVYIVCLGEGSSDGYSFPDKTNERFAIHDLLDKEVEDSYYYNNTKYYQELKRVMTNRNTCYQWRRHYVRENKKNLCPTLTANMGTGGHNVPLVLDHKGIRKLTPRECARLQGFDDSFILPSEMPNSALYKQIGNSVSIPVIEKIAKQILLSLL